jgi:hypothetical protein
MSIIFICISKDDPPPGRRRRLHPHASQCHSLLGGGWSSGDAASAEGSTGSRPPSPPPPSKPSTHGSLLLVLCSQRHPHHPQHERQEVNSPCPARAVHATGFSLARLIILLSSPSSPPPLLPFFFFIESFSPPLWPVPYRGAQSIPHLLPALRGPPSSSTCPPIG